MIILIGTNMEDSKNFLVFGINFHNSRIFSLLISINSKGEIIFIPNLILEDSAKKWKEIEECFTEIVGEDDSGKEIKIDGPKLDIEKELEAPGVQEALQEFGIKIERVRLFDPLLDEDLFELAYPLRGGKQ